MGFQETRLRRHYHHPDVTATQPHPAQNPRRIIDPDQPPRPEQPFNERMQDTAYFSLDEMRT
jgi:hypothetical protein